MASISHHVGEQQQLVPVIDYILINQLVVGSRFYPMPWLSPLRPDTDPPINNPKIIE